MSDPTRAPCSGVDKPTARPDDGSGAPGPSADDAVARLRAEVTDLRLRLEDEVRTHRVVVVDDAGIGRIRLSTTTDGESRVTLLDADGFERVRIGAQPDRGVVTIACRTQHDHPTRVEVFALDPETPDAAYAGVELIDRGDSVAGFVVYEGRPPRQWNAPQ
jgi:GAF domain-containing protein